MARTSHRRACSPESDKSEQNLSVNALHEVDAGSRNSYAGVKRLRGLFYKQKDLLIKVKSQNKKIR